MMKRFLLAGLALLALRGDVRAESETPRVLWNGTGTGGMHVGGAEIRPDAAAATAFGSYLSEGSLVAPGDAVSRFRYGVGGLYAPLKYLELGAAVLGTSVSNSLSNPERLSSFGDFRFAAKGSVQVNEHLVTGVRAQLLLFSGVKDAAGGSASGYGDTASYAGEWVSTMRYGGFASHLALGYLYDRTVNFHPGVPTLQERFAWGQTDFNQVTYGLNAGYETKFADYMVELSGEQPVGGGAPAFSASPVRVTPGVRLRPWGPLEAQLGADIALTSKTGQGVPAQPNYDLLAALRWQFDLSKGGEQPEAAPAEQAAPAPAPVSSPEPTIEAPAVEAPAPATTPAIEAPAAPVPQFGALTGRVISMATGAPIGGAKVTVEGIENPVSSTPGGNYVVAHAPAGKVTVHVAAEGMREQTVSGEVKAGGVTTLDVGLEPLVTTGSVKITVMGAGKPLDGADVLVNGKKAGVTAKDGTFTVKDVKAGTVEITARKTGFKPADAAMVEVAAGQSITQSVDLQPEPRPGFVEVKAVNEDRQAIAATVTIEGHPEWQRSLDPASGASTTFKLPPGTYRIRVEGKGYKPEVQEVQVPEDGELALRFKLTK